MLRLFPASGLPSWASRIALPCWFTCAPFDGGRRAYAGSLERASKAGAWDPQLLPPEPSMNAIPCWSTPILSMTEIDSLEAARGDVGCGGRKLIGGGLDFHGALLERGLPRVRVEEAQRQAVNAFVEV